MPMPGPLYYTKADVATLLDTGKTAPRRAGERLAASYVNFYIANEAVVVPQFGDPRVRWLYVRMYLCIYAYVSLVCIRAALADRPSSPPTHTVMS